MVPRPPVAMGALVPGDVGMVDAENVALPALPSGTSAGVIAPAHPVDLLQRQHVFDHRHRRGNVVLRRGEDRHSASSQSVASRSACEQSQPGCYWPVAVNIAIYG